MHMTLALHKKIQQEQQNVRQKDLINENEASKHVFQESRQ